MAEIGKFSVNWRWKCQQLGGQFTRKPQCQYKFSANGWNFANSSFHQYELTNEKEWKINAIVVALFRWKVTIFIKSWIENKWLHE